MIVKYPEDPDDSKIDTTYLDEWECFDAFSSFDMVIEDVSSDVKRVVFGIVSSFRAYLLMHKGVHLWESD